MKKTKRSAMEKSLLAALKASEEHEATCRKTYNDYLEGVFWIDANGDRHPGSSYEFDLETGGLKEDYVELFLTDLEEAVVAYEAAGEALFRYQFPGWNQPGQNLEG